VSWREPRWPQFLPTQVVLGFATLGPVGRWGRAPGTLGSLAGLVFFTVALAYASPVFVVLVSALLIWAAAGLCGEAERRLGQRDPGSVVLDEFVAMPLCYVGWQWLAATVPAWVVFLAGFLLFRLLDIAKPLGIGRLQELPGGWGVVADDVAAAVATCVLLHVGAALYAGLLSANV
jgi:phosphatidylglycerophosphatase A